jgi:hypothetical protein
MNELKLISDDKLLNKSKEHDVRGILLPSTWEA